MMHSIMMHAAMPPKACYVMNLRLFVSRLPPPLPLAPLAPSSLTLLQFFCFSLTSALEDTQQQQAPSTYIHMRSAFFLQRRSSRSWVLVFLIFSRLMR